MEGMTALRRKLLAMMFGGLLAMGFGGCMMHQPDARYIYQDGQFGVIGIPQNSPFGLKNYEKQAKALMAKHFPEGYEVVRAEEVVEGQRVLDRNRTSQLETEPTIDALNQKIKLGRLAESTSTQQKDSVAITESRIIYKKRSLEIPPGLDGFSAQATLAPELYLDPNELMRARNQFEIAEAKKGKSTTTVVSTPPGAPAKTADASAQKASAEVKK
ncbi:MAG: hypothetical protein ABS79_07665 [Planctomycetes bacterium SCN 63-9]|nr:MAG: hypothetical protein ABS79_07665 [Planctomycetes bacterium SCN 63-9]